MNSIGYWHLQMCLPDGSGGVKIDSKQMLLEERPVIGTGEWNKPESNENNKQCRNFKDSNNGIKIGDIVLVREGRTPIALCKVTSECFTSSQLAEKYININYRYVDVLEFYEGDETFPQSRGTLQRLVAKDKDSWNFINKWYNRTVCKMSISQIVNLLKQKKQVILQGAPGTGKTYITASVALSLLGESFEPDNQEEIMRKYDQLISQKRIFFTTFHQSMDYEDFVEGLKPVVDDGRMTYELRDGIFKTVCKFAEHKGSLDELDDAIEKLKEISSENPIVAKTVSGNEFTFTYRGGITFKALPKNGVKEHSVNIEFLKKYHTNNSFKDTTNFAYARGIYNYLIDSYHVKPFKPQGKDLNYVLIIDEINRGNISKIFGELITLLETDKRAGGEHPIKARLTYSGDEDFSVPSNLYIIGTMNTTDRSVGHIDYAIRRRFAFYTMEANATAISSYYEMKKIKDGTKEIALNLFNQIKEGIQVAPDFDIKDIMIGHSYFMADNKEALRSKVEYEIIPLLLEYEKDGLIVPSEKLQSLKLSLLRSFN